MKLLIMQSSPNSYDFLSLRHKYCARHPVLKHLQLTSYLSVTCISHPQKTTHKISFVHLYLYIRQHSPKRMFCFKDAQELAYWNKTKRRFRTDGMSCIQYPMPMWQTLCLGNKQITRCASPEKLTESKTGSSGNIEIGPTGL